MHFVYGLALISATVFIHAACSELALGSLRSARRHRFAAGSALARTGILAGIVFAMLLAAWVEAAIWAAFYVWVGAFARFADAFYFSIVTFTTLGYGDVTLSEEWRTLGAFEAANGILMFGWTTAIIVAAAQRVFFHRAHAAD